MHELSVTESLLDIALRHAQAANANKITVLNIHVGQLSSIVDDSVQFYWDLVAKDSIAEGAQLNFVRIPTRLRCQDCEHEYQPGEEQFNCPACGSQNIQIIAGKEFFLESIEVE
jgi:hydrogenase nickel incorporation protein HypA/HybF